MHQLQRLTSVHKLMAELHLQGKTRNQIAEIMGKSPEGVGLIMSCGLFQDHLARRSQSIERRQDEAHATGTVAAKALIDAASETAAKQLTALCVDDDKGMRYKASKGILDLAFGRITDGGQAGRPSMSNLTPEALEVLREGLRESREHRTKVVISKQATSDELIAKVA